MSGFDTVLFGRYPQTEDGGIKSVEWLVLKEEGRKILVISRYALDCRPYHGKEEPVTWETCDLRKWLNTEFLRAAFTQEEQEKIPSMAVPAEENTEYRTDPGRDTRDKVFLLSIAEAEQYFFSGESRACQGTEYCCAKKIYQSYNGCCWWWLRSPGHYSNFAAYVSNLGVIINYFNSVNFDFYAVRPALWIDLES